MAQLSKGIKIGYRQMTDIDTRGNGTYTYLPDITGIPALGGAPATHQTTDLEDNAHTYIAGLPDSGGNLDFPCNFTAGIIDAVDTAISLQNQGKYLEWAVEFPAPLLKRYYFRGEASVVYNESVDVDAPVTGTVSLVPNTVVENEDIT